MLRTVLAGVASACCLAALAGQTQAQSVAVFSQARDDETARPLTPQEQEQFQDPFFTLVLKRRPDAVQLADIEALIQPDPTKRRIFVVDEEIKDSRQPQSRRTVIDFTGSNEGKELGGNLMLSLFFSSDEFPETPDVEAWGWDEQNGVYNYYKLDRSGNTNPRFSWKFRVSSAKADRLTAGERAGTCLACHTSGVPIMKELAFPWNNWHSFTSAADYLTGQGAAAQRWPVASNPRFTQLAGGDALETTIQGAIIRFNNRKFADEVKTDAQGRLVVADARNALRPLFVTTEINLASASQPSGLHPLISAAQSGPTQPVKVPDSFFLAAANLAGDRNIVGVGIPEAKGFRDIAVVQPAEYKALVEGAGLKLRTSRGPLVGDTHFAWFTPEPGFAQRHWIDNLVDKKVISPAFAAAALAVDLENPIFSAERASLLAFIPQSFTAEPGASHPDALTREVITRLEAAGQLLTASQADFLALLKTADPVSEVKARVIAYRERIGQKLTGATRQAELQRLFTTLMQRRQRFASDPLFRPLRESGALVPMP